VKKYLLSPRTLVSSANSHATDSTLMMIMMMMIIIIIITIIIQLAAAICGTGRISLRLVDMPNGLRLISLKDEEQTFTISIPSLR
jgi:hypothetical protein